MQTNLFVVFKCQFFECPYIFYGDFHKVKDNYLSLLKNYPRGREINKD